MSEFSKKSDPVSGDLIDLDADRFGVRKERWDSSSSSSSSSSFTGAFVQVRMKRVREARQRRSHLPGEK